MTDIQIGQIVKGFYKTGVYIGEVTAVKPSTYLVQVKSVLTHPTQGDLHHPKEADVPFFRKDGLWPLGNRRTSLIIWSSLMMVKSLIIKYH